MAEKQPVVAVVGPTATGKTALGLALARRFHGEIVSCDSMQVYRGLPVGTAQPTSEELDGTAYHLVACLDPLEEFSVSDYVALAGQTVSEIHSRGRLPILVGGTGLYVRSFLRGFAFREDVRDESLRRELFARAETDGTQSLHDELRRLDPAAAEAIHPHNTKRVIRALEYCILSGEPFSAQAERSKQAESPYRSLMLCLTYRDREKLYRRIDARVDRMLEAGLLDEARMLYGLCRDRETKPPTAAQAIGYKEFFPYFDGLATFGDAVENVKRESRRYAKRQITWFSREPDARFVYGDEAEDFEALAAECASMVEAFLAEEDRR